MDTSAMAQPPAKGITSPPAPRKLSRGEWIALATILLGSLALRLALLPVRWINPDEGAHLMDGRLLLDGFIPLVDFDSRQVLYVYILAGWLRLSGFHLETARLLPLAASLGVGLLVFAIARRFFGPRPAVFAAAVYSFFPLSVLWSANVHMQPITLILACVGFYFLAGAVGERPIRAAGVAGFWFGLTYYVRESALAVLAAAVLFLIVTAGTWTERTRRIGALVAGFLFVSAVMIGSYSTVLSPGQLWHGPLNPISLPLRVIGGNEVWVGPEESVQRPVPEALPRFQQQSVGKALSNMRLMVVLSLFLLVGLAGSLRQMSRTAFRGANTRHQAVGFLLLWLWLGLMGIAYGYWTFKLGFYPQYFTEMVPPLAIAFGAVVPPAAERLAGRELPAWLWATIALALAGIFFTARAFELSALVYVGAPPLLMAGVVTFARARRRQTVWALAALTAIAIIGELPPIPGGRILKAAAGLGALAVALTLVRSVGRAARADFVLVTLAAGAAVFSIQRAGRALSARYQCVWPPELLAPIARTIQERSTPQEQVMSGAVSWEFEADRRPFLLISHPLKFLARQKPGERSEVERGLATVPPRLVVLDGYTERTYGRLLPGFTELIERQYQLLGTWEGGQHPVRLFWRGSSAPLGP